MAEEEVLHYFKRNVNRTISVRMFRGDRDGIVLNIARPLVEVQEKDLRVFKDVNKAAILQGLLIEVEEPTVTWETANALTDEDIQTLLSSFMKLKNTLDSIDSLPILYKIHSAAEEKGSSKKTIALIDARIEALVPEQEVFERGEMGGSYDTQ